MTVECWTEVLKIVNEHERVEVVYVNDRKNTRKHVTKSSLPVIHCTRTHIGEGGAWPVSGSLMYLNPILSSAGRWEEN